jgi:DNA-binding SARP family transcriptional activator/TolB-like protein
MLENDPRAVAASSLEIHLLGPFRLIVDGQALDERRFTRRKPKLLIKLLALQAHHQLHREQAMELLWPESDPESATNNLHKAIHMARHALESELKSGADSRFIITQGPQILLRAPETLWIDVDAFVQREAQAIKSGDPLAYEAALKLYVGELLPEDRYEDWAAPRREQLRMQYQELLLGFAQVLEARGEYHRSIERYRELLAGDESNEEAHRRLMRLYAQTGNRHQSLRQYHQCCKALRRELASEPEQATVKLHSEILSGHIPPLSFSKAEPNQLEDWPINSLAILPFFNSSADPNAEYLSDGITESIINKLSQVSQLHVMAPSTVFRFKGQVVDPQEIGRSLKVRAVLSGRVLQLEERLIIRADLVNAADGSQLWGEQYNEKLSDILVVQEVIAKRISEKLQLKLTGEDHKQLAKRQTGMTEAYHAYLRGRYHWNKRTPEGLKKAIDYFKQAIDVDPCYALAYVGLADAYVVLGSFGVGVLAPRDAYPRAKEAAAKALEIDETLVEAHASLGYSLGFYDWDWDAADKEFSRAIDLKPDCTTAHFWYGFYMIAMGRLDEALSEIRLAHELEPLSLSIHTDFGFIPYFMREYDLAIEEYRKLLEIDENFVYTHWKLGLAYEQKEMYDDAITEFQRAITLSEGSTHAIVLLGHAYAISGRKKEALKILAELRELSTRKYVSSYRVATIYLGLGEKELTFEWLERAYEERDMWLSCLKVDPVLDDIRSDERFQGLLQRVGLAPTAP